MHGYSLPTVAGALAAAGVLVLTLAAGPWIARGRPSRAQRAWARVFVLAAAGVVVGCTQTDQAGTRLLLVCGVVFLAMKVLVQAEARLAGRPVPTGKGWLCFALLWPGMRPWAFAGPAGPARPGGVRLLVGGGVVTLLGLALLGLARLRAAQDAHEAELLLELLLGIGFVVHFGVFRSLAGFWRLNGRPVTALFDAPVRSRSLAEFWARRWNLAFSEMLQLALQRPLRGALGPRGAIALCFVASGLLHELALSVPARGGYGGPLLYFVLHGLLVALEGRIPWGAGRAAELARRAWVLGWVLLPLPLLLHGPALRAILLPLAGL